MPCASHALVITPISPSPLSSEVNFGAEVTGIDLENLSEAEFVSLEDALYRYHVLVVKNQGHLTPQGQYKINCRFDPLAVAYGHGADIEKMKQSVLQNDLISIPDQPEVKLLGNGTVYNHENLPVAHLKHPMHFGFHKDPLSIDATSTRFYRWHIDAALYELNPPKCTTLLALVTPSSGTDTQTIVYDDSTGASIPDAPLGTTAFVSGATSLAVLPGHLQELALRTTVVYAPHPYIWIKHAKALPTGLCVYSDGLEIPFTDLPEFEPSKVTVLPAVWKNPKTGALSLQIHGCCVQDLIIDGKAVGDLKKVRQIVHDLMRPGIEPQRVYTHDWKEGDCVIFSNWQLWHTVVGTLAPNRKRVYHQCNLAASVAPEGPSEADIENYLRVR